MKRWELDRALKLLEKEGRTRQWLAQYIGISRNALNHYLSGRRVPAHPVIKLMAQALNTTEEYLIGTEAKAVKQKTKS